MKNKDDLQPAYIGEAWPSNQEKTGIYYALIITGAGAAEHYPTVKALQDAISACRNEGREIASLVRVDDNNHTLRELIPETREEQNGRQNRERCREIAQNVEACAEGLIYKCPGCGEHCTMEEVETENGEILWHMGCGCYVNEEPEQMGLYDFLEDVLDIEYRISADKKYRSVRLMVTCGGPNIYIDTKNKLVQLYWWTDYAEYPISYNCCDELDDIMEELFNC